MRSMRSAILSIQSTSSLIPLPLTTCSRVPLLRCRYRAHLSKKEVAPHHPRAGQLLARTSWRALLFDLNDTRRQLADGHRGARVPSQQSPRCVLPAVPASRDERHRDSPDGRLWAPDNAAHTHANGGADDVLRLHAHRDAAANITRRSVGTAPALERVESRELVTVLSSRGPSITPSYLRWLYRTYPLPRLAGICSGLRDTIAVSEPGRPDGVHGRMSR